MVRIPEIEAVAEAAAPKTLEEIAITGPGISPVSIQETGEITKMEMTGNEKKSDFFLLLCSLMLRERIEK